MLLQPIPQGKPIVSYGGLEYIETTIENYLPASICGDVTCMGGASAVEGPDLPPEMSLTLM